MTRPLSGFVVYVAGLSEKPVLQVLQKAYADCLLDTESMSVLLIALTGLQAKQFIPQKYA